ncbi:MAG: tRNA (adenosine(37)-N6)-dimethylallyltransferase MiaA [Rhodothermales bacterium]|nr:tRNA (adenosine(37)-N6)-dimethylallyltransferase MiaA [Rhodothermales bacterium]
MPLDPDAVRAGRLPIPVLTGPTAVGKTALSLDAAERMGAEIISADSRQVYRRMTIGTAKPTAAELDRVPHHFIDELDLGDPFSAGAFARAATQRIRAILERGRLPLVVGGSTLYLHALIHGLADIPDVAPAVRRAIEERLRQQGGEALYAELQRHDPDAAATLDPTKTQRLVRALEVLEATGRPLSSFQQRQPASPFRYQVVVLHRERAELYERINRRVLAMLEAGLLDEVRAILAEGVDPRTNALRTIGYREPIRHLRGDIGYGEMVRQIQRNSRRYAKRQLTWFRREPDWRWVPVGDADRVSLFDLQ